MEQLPTPPATPAVRADSSGLTSPGKSYAELSKELDSVLERYLHLLDRQQRLQDEIGREFSSGFFSLVRANNSCPPGRRYGEDYYDERMKATRKLSIIFPSTNPGKCESALSSLNQTISNPSFAIENALLSPSNTEESNYDTKDGNGHSDSDTSSSCQSSRPTKPDKVKQSKKPSTNQKSSNPINWFGILVPPALRSAQQSFCTALEGPIPALASVITEMREVERDVEVLRSQLASAIADNDGNESGKQCR
ncbi:hypothetical protein AJ78_02971 [Emergomyces pasteurianus Ep9510]|uniref:Vacuolar ATPase assembly protein VMA22 n=1 Tax=Emergomyces pasteurianus Ep9510 TaxID=1447872 RepID=A0A1J9PLX1_9EURO|nr:hypothetical protein AJ78_02971 [Emergomyces pasteurianus Ep9510]